MDYIYESVKKLQLCYLPVFNVKENLVMSNSSKVSVVREGFAERGFVEIFYFPFFLINEQEISTLNCLFKGCFTLFCISNLIVR